MASMTQRNRFAAGASSLTSSATSWLIALMNPLAATSGSTALRACRAQRGWVDNHPMMLLGVLDRNETLAEVSFNQRQLSLQWIAVSAAASCLETYNFALANWIVAYF